MSDWSGSSTERKPQGNCSPFEQVHHAYSIDSGTECRVKKQGRRHRNWAHHKTREDLLFESPYYERPGVIAFKHDGWVVEFRKQDIERIEYKKSSQPKWAK